MIAALWQNWQASDIAWSMWISSLVGGGVLILTSITFNKVFVQGAITPVTVAQMTGRKISEPELQEFQELSKDTKIIRLPKLVSIGMGLFFISFFCIHFGGFHWVHSAFLQKFFPLQDVAQTYSMTTIIGQCLSLYWPFVFASLIGHMDDIYKNVYGKGSLAMHEPYKTVIKNHIIILLLGLMTALSIEGYTLYILLVMYFFPWGILKETLVQKN